MKTKYFFMAAIGALTLVSCADESFIGDQKLLEGATDAPIGFNLSTAYATRADKTGSAAATDLGNRFIVWGEKSETDKNAPASGHLVFQNYQVNYGANTAYTTTSNTKDWEYVGYGHSLKHNTNITTKDGGSDAAPALKLMQTIKYWDYSASNYVFTAVSVDSTDINNDYVTIQKNVSGTTVYDKGYKLTLTANAHPEKIFIADRQVITPTAGTDRNATNAYGGNVTLRFRNLLSHVRVGMYETIPGHKVTIKKFYYVDNAAPTFGTMSSEGTDKFYANVPNVATTSAATLTVTYQSSGATVNQPTIAISGATTANYIALGGADAASTGLKATADLKTAANDPTFNETSGAYTAVFPQEANAKTLKLKVDYTLTADGTGETIDVNGATAEIPAEYLQWKPNYKYTYLFKISDNTNGSTGQGVVGLYPITFDAVEVIAEDGKAEYITTVSEPSITTFGAIYNTSSSKYTTYQTGKDEYQAQTSPNQLDIFVAAVDGSTVVNPTLGTNMNVYLATTTNKNSYPITEASVAEALAEISAGAKKITVTNINTDATTNFGATPAKAEVVPSEDGSILSVKCVLSSDPGDWVASDANVYYSDAACTSKVTTAYADGTYYKKFDSALKLTGVKSTAETAPADKAIVVEYVKTAATYYTSSETHTFADASALATWESSNYKLYDDAEGTTPATATGALKTYYKRTAVKAVGKYAYKVIHIQAAP